MSVLIKGMEMPSCNDCPLAGDFKCNLMPSIPALCKEYDMAVQNGKRLNNCPLVEIPPHGDLIDRNKLYEKTAEWEAQALHMVEVTMHDEDTSEWREWSIVLTERSAFKFDVADAPTVIEAEEDE